MKKRKRITLATDGLSNTELVAHGRTIATKLNADTRFDTLDSKTAQLGPMLTSLETLEAQRAATESTLTHLTEQVENKREEVETLLAGLGSGVESVAQGNTEVIVASGYLPESDRQVVGPLGQPQRLRTQVTNMEGEIKFRWKTVRGAKSYVVEYALHGTEDWQHGGVSTRASFALTGLESGRKYRARVRAVGSAGPGPWSDEAVKMAA